MSLISVATKLRNFITASNWKTQIFTDSSGAYKVIDISNYVKEHSSLVDFNVAKLAEVAFQPSKEESYDETPGSPKFVERAMESDLSFPIIVIRYPDEDFIADGNHRLWKANSLGHRTIKGYLLSEEDLHNNIPHEDD